MTGRGFRQPAGITDVAPFGDRGLLVSVADVWWAHRLTAAIDGQRREGRAPPGVDETVVGLASVVVTLQPGSDLDDVGAWLRHLLTEEQPDRSPVAGAGTGWKGQRRLEVPVVFDGPDLVAVAGLAGVTAHDVVSLMTTTDLSVAFVGFSPGFPYLVGLPPPLTSIPRRPSPRAAVAPGSVAVAGGFASIYPQATPGGWMLVGRSSLSLFDPDRPPYATLAAGDTVRFTARPPSQAGSFPEARHDRRPLTAVGLRYVEVAAPGLLSLVEDGGRRRTSAIGVPPAGAADTDAMRLANRLVGNPDRAATIEVTAFGPRLRFSGDAHLAVVASSSDGVEVSVDGRPVPDATLTPIGHGQVVEVGRVLVGLRAYVAVSGGFQPPLVVGARSDDVLSGLGPGPLAVGDRLAIGPATRPRGSLLPGEGPGDALSRSRPVPVRVILGPHRPPGAFDDLLADPPWTVGGDSNRVGVRLDRPGRPPRPHDLAVPSFGMVTGAVQLPPDGNPIILGPDHATVGGYPVVACVIAADLSRVGQLQPGEQVTFLPCDVATARHAYLHQEHLLSVRVVGWFPTEAAT